MPGPRKQEIPVAERRLYELWAELCDLGAAEALLEWDQETMLPAGAGAHRARGDVLATLAAAQHRCLTAPELGDVLAECAEIAEEGSVLEAQVKSARREVDRAVKVPEKLLREIASARAHALETWRAARERRDFSHFAEPLDRLISLRREEAIAVADGKPLYDAVLDRFEPDAQAEELEVLFRELTASLTPLVKAVAATGKSVDEEEVRGHFPGEQQIELGRRAAAAVGYDFDAGRMDAAAHPFCVRVHPHDTRMAYRYDEADFRSCLLAILHESGHAMYEQGMPAKRHRTPVDSSSSMGIHESQALLWENHVGRSRGFWQWLLPIFHDLFPDAARLDVETIWPTLHTVRPSLIRVDADETTYNLHVAVRFEIERRLFRDTGREIPIRDLPTIWNELYDEYLGVQPADDAEGVLQDIHWASGLFGYFPSYTFGILGAAQLFAAAQRELGDRDEAFAAGDFEPLLDWLRRHVHQRGRTATPATVIADATGRPPGVNDLLAHLRANAETVYGPL